MTAVPPAWTHLQPASLKALLEPPGKVPRAVRLTPDAVPADAALSVPMVVAARLLLERAVEAGGLALTPGGALKRVDVRHVFDRTDWPGYDRATTLALNKVINEDDAHGVLFTRIVMQAAGLLRKRSGPLKASRAGKAMLAADSAPALLASLFATTFWKVNLQDFDGNPIDFWPQHHIGVILWSLSVSAHGWSRVVDLLPACTIVETLEEPPRPDHPEFAMISRVLRPLTWLGLMENRNPEGHAGWSIDEQFRKTPLFDALLAFDIEMQGEGAVRH